MSRVTYFFIFFTIPPPKKNIGPMIRIGREIHFLPYAGFLHMFLNLWKEFNLAEKDPESLEFVASCVHECMFLSEA